MLQQIIFYKLVKSLYLCKRPSTVSLSKSTTESVNNMLLLTVYPSCYATERLKLEFKI